MNGFSVKKGRNGSLKNRIISPAFNDQKEAIAAKVSVFLRSLRFLGNIQMETPMMICVIHPMTIICQ